MGFRGIFGGVMTLHVAFIDPLITIKKTVISLIVTLENPHFRSFFKENVIFDQEKNHFFDRTRKPIDRNGL